MNHLDDITLNEYLDHTLDESAHTEAESHLYTCADCRARLADLRMLFADLDKLPEVPLEHDLSPTVLARLPRENSVKNWSWTRALAAQLGVVVGFVLWLVVQIVPLIRIPQFVLPMFSPFDIQSLVVKLFTVQFPIPKIRFPVFNYQMPTIEFQFPFFNIPFSPNQIAMLAILVSLLWVVGNIILLKGRQEVES